MKKEEAEEIIACLSKERTIFHYYKDRYAFLLLSYIVGSGRSIQSLKKSPYSSLLDKPAVRDILKQCGHGYLDQETLKLAWHSQTEPFLLTVDIWGDGNRTWDQTTRGDCNIVLQLNFSNKHDSIYRNLVKPKHTSNFNYTGHPILLEGDRAFFRETLSWARIDLDFKNNEALIEEVQSDWVRKTASLQNRITRLLKRNVDVQSIAPRWGVEGRLEDVQLYLTEVIQPYTKMWAEATLAAAISFISEELGIETIYYHSFETGCRAKNIRYDLPPRSLYTNLPKKFCFLETAKTPEFIASNKTFKRSTKKLKQPKWFQLQLKEAC